MEEKKKVTDAHMRATAKYERENYFKTLVRFNKKDEGRIRAAAGKSLNGFIVKCVLDALDKPIKNKEVASEAPEQPNSQNNNGGSVLLPIEDKESEYERICAEYGGYESVLYYTTQMQLMRKYDFDSVQRLREYADSKTIK